MHADSQLEIGTQPFYDQFEERLTQNGIYTARFTLSATRWLWYA